ncbi:MAG: PQQ-binding-like beta-propeller repeat protein [Polyangiaceae bacterium]
MKNAPWRNPQAAPGVDAGPPSLADSAPLPNAPIVDHAARTLHGDLHRTHRAHGFAPRNPVEGWISDVGGGVEAQVTSSPDGTTLYATTLSGSLVALARADGKVRWRADLGGRSYTTPCVADDGTIYVGSDAKKFFAVSPLGAILWTLETSGDADTAPAIAKNGSILFAAGKELLDARKGGDVAWRFSAKDKIFTAPAIADDGTIYFGSQDDHAYALTSAGAQKWAVALGADVDGAPVIGDDGAIFFGDDADELVRIEQDGRVAWKVDVGGFVRGPLSITRGGSLVFGTFGPAPREVRVDAKSGSILGSFRIQGTGAKEFGIVGGALEDDSGAVFFGAQDDAVYAVDRNGALRFRIATGGDVDAPLTLLPDGALVIAGDDAKVRLLEEKK